MAAPGVPGDVRIWTDVTLLAHLLPFPLQRVSACALTLAAERQGAGTKKNGEVPLLQEVLQAFQVGVRQSHPLLLLVLFWACLILFGP